MLGEGLGKWFFGESNRQRNNAYLYGMGMVGLP